MFPLCERKQVDSKYIVAFKIYFTMITRGEVYRGESRDVKGKMTNYQRTERRMYSICVKEKEQNRVTLRLL